MPDRQTTAVAADSPPPSLGDANNVSPAANAIASIVGGSVCGVLIVVLVSVLALRLR